jgi:hypothetical protein
MSSGALAYHDHGLSRDWYAGALLVNTLRVVRNGSCGMIGFGGVHDGGLGLAGLGPAAAS